MKETLIVIPYCSSGAQGRELELAVAGWRKHFKEDYLIVLAGEGHPVCDSGDDICCVHSPRVAPIEGMYRQHLDYVSCLKKVHDAFPDTDGFIMVADDCYAVNDFDMVDVKLLKSIGEIGERLDTTNHWKRDKARTREALLAGGYTLHNYTSHLPQWYEWDKVEELWERYQMDRVSYTIEDLYYNIYYGSRIPINVHRQDVPIKCGLYADGYPLSVLEGAAAERVWITNSPIGWSQMLEDFLAAHYGLQFPK